MGIRDRFIAIHIHVSFVVLVGFYFSISLGATLNQTTEGMKIKQPSIVTVGSFDVTGLIQLIFRNGCR
jgi:hypothetical protein